MTEPGIPRFRFAPSPTGSPHVGSLHTALFNWALARSMGGDLILRIDDTDAARSTSQFADEMLEALHWLGLDWDEGPDMGGEFGPYVQSQRRQRHLDSAAALYKRGDAYYGDDADDDQGPGAGEPLRLRLPQKGEVVVDDALRGPIRFNYDQLSDPVIARRDGSPLYHLASVVDDHEMAISHVARGEEWIASTPIHLYIYERLGWQPPVWVHLPLIHDLQGQKLSKRDERGAYLARDFEELGYLPPALFNYLLLLGWSAPDGREILGKADVRRHFRLADLSASPARFDWDKLNWINRHYLQKHSDAQLAKLVRPFLEDAYPDVGLDDRWLERLVGVIRDDLGRLADAVVLSEWALSDSIEFNPDAEKALAGEPAHRVLVHLIAELAQLVLLDEQTAKRILENLQRQFAESKGWTAHDVYWPIRAALTGRVRGPALYDIMGLLGKARCLQRVAAILRAS